MKNSLFGLLHRLFPSFSVRKAISIFVCFTTNVIFRWNSARNRGPDATASRTFCFEFCYWSVIRSLRIFCRHFLRFYPSRFTFLVFICLDVYCLDSGNNARSNGTMFPQTLGLLFIKWTINCCSWEESRSLLDGFKALAQQGVLQVCLN